MLCANNRNKGFTLIEMSIVLIVIGLIIGGIMTGTSLIDSSKRQSVMTDIETYKTQIELFEDKYAGLPGDLFNAEEHWPDARYATDNGDGDGLIETGTEDFLAWEHLYLADLIAFAYTGTGPNYTVNSNIPESQYKGKGYRAVSASGVLIYEATATTRLRIELAAPNGAAFTNAALLPKDAENIDIKMDDGLPDTGYVVALDGADAVNNCILNTAGVRSYIVRSKEEECILVFYTKQ